MRRSLADARDAYEATVKPNATVGADERARAILEEAEANATLHIADRVEREATATREAIRDVQRELSAIRDGYDELASAAHMSVSDFTAGMRDLQQRERAALANLDQLTTDARAIEEMESDPLSAFDQLTSRAPNLRRDYPW